MRTSVWLVALALSCPACSGPRHVGVDAAADAGEDAGVGDAGVEGDAGAVATAPRVLVDGLAGDVHATACAVGADGTLHVAYTTADGVHYLADVPGGVREDVDPGASPIGRPSIAVREGLPWVSYIDSASGEAQVEVAVRNGIWLAETIPSARFAGSSAPLVTTPAGLWLGGSVWQASSSGSERYVVFWEYDGRVWGSTRFLLRGDPHAAAVDSLGLVQLAMYGGALTVPTYVAVLRDERTGWVEYQIEPTPDVSGQVALALDAADRPHVVHDDGGQLLHAFSPREEEWETDTIEGTRTSWFAIGVRGSSTPIVAYYQDGERDLRLVEREGTSWRRETLDEDGDVGRALSMAVDAAGRARVVYFDATRRQLKIVER